MKITIYILFIFIITVVLASTYGCNSSNEHANHQSEEVYTCPMHPSVRSDRPAACPICGMDLVKITEMPSADTPGAENVVFLMPRQQILANIKTEKVQYREIGEHNLLLGTVAVDPRTSTAITAKVPGRIEKLYVRNPLQKVFSGQPIYDIYSEELLVDQKEFLLSYAKWRSNTDNETLKLMYEASKNKLLLWGMNQPQINNLANTGKAAATTTFYSPENGVLQSSEIKEGQYVQAGSTIASITKLSNIWVEAQVYAEEFSLLQKNPEVFIEAEALNEPIKGKLVFENPSIEETTRLNIARFQVENPGGKLQPSMMVYVRLQSAGKRGLVIPKSALLPEKMPTVWVKIGDDAFERRMVKTGTGNRSFVEIIEGVKEKEKIVVSGAYLINSEFVLKKGGAQKHNH